MRRTDAVVCCVPQAAHKIKVGDQVWMRSENKKAANPFEPAKITNIQQNGCAARRVRSRASHSPTMAESPEGTADSLLLVEVVSC